jgi:hypothetical protein
LIIQYSDVGIDPEAEEEMKSIQPFGRQAIEEEIEMNNDEEEQDDMALQVCFHCLIREVYYFVNQFDYKLLSAKLIKIAKVDDCKQRNRKQIYELARK